MDVLLHSFQQNCRSRVDLSIIGLVTEEVEAEVAVGGVEEDLRNLQTVSKTLLCCDGSFCRWSSSGEPQDVKAEIAQDRHR